MELGAEGGGFFPGQNDEGIAEPTARTFRMPISDYGFGSGGGGGGGFFADEEQEHQNGAGGFSAEDFKDGGGFIAEDKPVAAAAQSPVKANPSTVPLTAEAGGFMLEEEPQDNRPVNPSPSKASLDKRPAQYELIVEPSPSKPKAKTKSPSPFPPPQDEAQSPTTKDAPNHPTVLSNNDPEVAPLPAERTSTPEAQESDDDQQSLLSHDPEDEDADPEWLMSDYE